jgi:D-tyrosyl-tRNA(Tyr) deacylase
MRALIQRVSAASVTVGGKITGRVEGPGLLVLLGVTHTDTPEIAAALAAKTWDLRIMADERSAADLGAGVLVVSQFTLYADTRKGRRPSWSAAAPRPVSEPLFDAFCAALRERGADVQTGTFGAHMDVSLVNEGPVTILLDSDPTA